MLRRTLYSEGYVASTRTTLRTTVTEYRKLAKSGAPYADFERQFFNMLVLALDRYFVHRPMPADDEVDSPLSEVRLLATSIMEDDGRLGSDPATPSSHRWILGYSVGDEIRLDPDSFTRLSEAFLDEVERRYV